MDGEDTKGAFAFVRASASQGQGSIKSIASFLLGESTGIRELSMAEIARRSFTSKPSLVRFAQAAGFSGWTSFRGSFLEEAAVVEDLSTKRRQVDVNHPFKKDTDGSDVLATLARIKKLAFDEVERSVSPALLSAAAEALVSARSCLVLATMQNVYLGEMFASKMRLMGVNVGVPVSEESPSTARFLVPGDCVVAISYSGLLGKRLPLSLIPALRERGQQVVAITNSHYGQLRELADTCLGFAPLEHYHDKMAGFYSEACTSFILDALYAACYVKRFDESRAWRQGIVADLRGTIPQDFKDRE